MPKYGLHDRGKTWEDMKKTANRTCRDSDTKTGSGSTPGTPNNNNRKN